MRASVECGGRSLSQYSQFGLSCSAMVDSSFRSEADHRKSSGKFE
jgi:hypothetical protein